MTANPVNGKIWFLLLLLLTGCGGAGGDGGQRPEQITSGETTFCPGTGPAASPRYVIGGEQAYGSADPMADLVSRSTVALVARGRVSCTATLIDERLLVTAAHCLLDPFSMNSRLRDPVPIEPGRLRVGFGNPDPDSGPGAGAGYSEGCSAEIAGYRIHPDFDVQDGDAAGRFYDIGVVLLDQPVPSPLVPVPLAPADLSLGGGDTIVLAGFGKTADDDTGLNPALRLLRGQVEEVHSSFGEFDLVRGEGQGICTGDSGGPAFAMTDGGPVVVGAASRLNRERGQLSCHAGGGIYTDLREYAGFIHAGHRDRTD